MWCVHRQSLLYSSPTKHGGIAYEGEIQPLCHLDSITSFFKQEDVVCLFFCSFIRLNYKIVAPSRLFSLRICVCLYSGLLFFPFLFFRMFAHNKEAFYLYMIFDENSKPWTVLQFNKRFINNCIFAKPEFACWSGLVESIH